MRSVEAHGPSRLGHFVDRGLHISVICRKRVGSESFMHCLWISHFLARCRRSGSRCRPGSRRRQRPMICACCARFDDAPLVNLLAVSSCRPTWAWGSCRFRSLASRATEGTSAPAAPTSPGRRRRVYYGTVVDWKGKFGWVEPFPPIEGIPSARKHGGKVYVANIDVMNVRGMLGGGLTVGQMVQFKLYTDASGMGGEQVQLVR
ncbi:unnamed protein product [Prorocentrum cordatum]|uniref:DUF35 domain-containing protein n=1 Tax=Prorocentrum cordatum TaxID=2364126 RepID=A0ABN9T276_9DINO|nr:unnamed protein product [Polarella glacialis]